MLLAWTAKAYSFRGDVHRRHAGYAVDANKELTIIVCTAHRSRAYTHLPYAGWVYVGSRLYGSAVGRWCQASFDWRWTMAVLRRQQPGGDKPSVALPVHEVVLDAQCLLLEHCSATKYPDGTPRTPGSFKVENIGSAYRCTVYDHDAGLRLPVSGPNLPEVFAAVEVLLGAVDAPWEVDKYLTGLVKQRPKSRKK